MNSPFPGMDPYLEHPALWPDFHNRLLAALADDLTERVAPRYYVGLERRTYLLQADDLVLVGRPDLAVVTAAAAPGPVVDSTACAVKVVEVAVPVPDLVSESLLEVHEVKSGKLVTIVELLSPANKLNQQGRQDYQTKRGRIFGSLTNLVEIDLLRAGRPMPVFGPPVDSHYRILISRGQQRPRASLVAFNVDQPIPVFRLPLLPGDEEPEVGLNRILHDVYRRARFDLRLDYAEAPPLSGDAALWADQLVRASGLISE